MDKNVTLRKLVEEVVVNELVKMDEKVTLQQLRSVVEDVEHTVECDLESIVQATINNLMEHERAHSAFEKVASL